MKKYNVAVVGATGAVGEEILRVLEEFNFPVKKLFPLTSSRSANQEVFFNNKDIMTIELTDTVFEELDVDIALFSAGGSVSAHFAPLAARSGAVVIDNTSHFRMVDGIPLVVPEVNPEDVALWKRDGIIANPNCSTIQMVQALKPLDDAFDLQRIDVSTYQATSGAGRSGMEELVEQMKAFFAFDLDDSDHKAFKHQIAVNVIPQIDVFLDNDFTKEEMKMVQETSKIMHKEIEVAATCVRVPTLRGHAESITLTFDGDVDAAQAKKILKSAPNIIVMDTPSESHYPMPAGCVDRNETFIGRIRADLYRSNVLHLWVVADNLRVGAATNAVRIAQKWIELDKE